MVCISSKENSFVYIRSILWVKLNSGEKISNKTNWKIPCLNILQLCNISYFMRLLSLILVYRSQLLVLMLVLMSQTEYELLPRHFSFRFQIYSKYAKFMEKALSTFLIFVFFPLFRLHIIGILQSPYWTSNTSINIIYTFYIFNISVISRDVLKYISAIII